MRHVSFVLAALVAAPAALSGQTPPRPALLTRIDSVVTAEMERTGAPGAAVAVRYKGELILAKGYGYEDLESKSLASTESVFRIGSITKQFTASAIMQLVEQGKIGLDDPMTKYLPDYPTQGNVVTIRHLLTHTSGIKSYTGLGPKFWNEASRIDLSDDQLLAMFKDLPFDFKPGERYLYNNSAFYILGMIIGKVSGTPYPEYVRTHLFQPLGLTSTSYCDDRAIVPHRANGYEVQDGKVSNAVPLSLNIPGAAGALCSTVLDLLRWEQALDAGRVVSAASRETMRTPFTLNDGKKTGYGFGIGIGDLEGRRAYAHSGGINGFITFLAYYPDEDLTVAVLTNSGSGPAPRIGQLVARSVLGLSLPPVPTRPGS